MRLASAGLSIVVLALVYYYKNARLPGFFPSCPFHFFTGLYCPGCGSQRAFSALLHGHPWQAASYNILLIICFPLLIYSGYCSVVSHYNHSHSNQNILYSPAFVKVLLAFIVIFGVLRNIPVYPFNLLAPHNVAPFKPLNSY